RYYASELSTWLSTDPMSDKYPSLTPYNYCANNPVKLIDPNGEEIWIISSGGSKIVYSEGMQSINFDSYTAETINALNKLSSTKTIGLQIKQLSVNKNMMINVIENSNTTQAIVKTYIDATNTGSAYLTQDILFDAALGIENIFTGEILSPATALGHEFGHIISAIFDIKGFNRRNATKREDVWDTEEEFYNINTYELGIAKEWGELQRDGHNTMDKNGKEKYKTVKTKSSTSNEKIIE
ncbi:MAG: RHS repeat-associated core domain-containing protein, partial [Bacteroidales bacterium]